MKSICLGVVMIIAPVFVVIAIEWGLKESLVMLACLVGVMIMPVGSYFVKIGVDQLKRRD